MNKSSSFALALTLTTLAASSAFAQSAAPVAKSRADIAVELRAAQASGQYAAQLGGDYRDVVLAYTGKSVKTRDQVHSELVAARASGEYPAQTIGSDYRDAFATRATPATKTRVEVQAELSAARRNGKYEALNASDYSDRFANM